MPDPFQSLSSALADRVAALAPHVVGIESGPRRSSGFLWRAGLVVAADEALAEDGEIAVILPGGERRAASLAGRDPTTDVALLRLEGGGPAPLTAAPAGPARAGALALAVGAVDGAPFASLCVLAFAGPAWRSMRGGRIDARVELDLRLRPESEGALVVDAAGALLGMVVAGPRGRALCIPASTVDRVADRLASHGRIGRAWMGLGLQPVRAHPDGVHGVLVMEIAADGPGAACGLQQGDVIVAWDGRPLPSLRELLLGLGPEAIGASVRLGLRRSGASAEAVIVLGERPAR